MPATKRSLHLTTVMKRRRYQEIIKSRQRLYETGDPASPPEISDETLAQIAAQPESQPQTGPPPEVAPSEPETVEVEQYA